MNPEIISVKDPADKTDGGGAEKRKNSKSFWGETEQKHSAIEDFGYHVKTEIRKSENASVYIATDNNGKTVAVKRITVPFFADGYFSDRESVEERIRQEAEALSRISSDCSDRFVVTYNDYKVVESLDKLKCDLYICTDCLPALKQTYDGKNMCMRDILAVGADICEALDRCCAQGRIHNNINLNSIYVNDRGRYALGDFVFYGSRQNEAEYCAAPELTCEEPSAASDIYALGMVLYVMLNGGLPPFAPTESDEDIRAAVKRLKSGETPSPLGVDRRLYDIISKAISPKDRRYTSAKDMKNDIDFLERSVPDEWLSQPVGKMPDACAVAKKDDFSPIPATEKKQRRKKTPEEAALKRKNVKDFILIGILTAALIAGVAVGAVFLSKSGNQKIYSLIDSGSYAVAFKEIDGLREDGENVDELAKAYIDRCMKDKEYKRVSQAIALLSEETYTDADYYKSIIEEMMQAGKERIAEGVVGYLSGKSPELDEMIMSLN